MPDINHATSFFCFSMDEDEEVEEGSIGVDEGGEEGDDPIEDLEDIQVRFTS